MGAVDGHPTLVIASRWADRIAGLLVPRPDGCVLLLAPCKSVHTFGMASPLDLAFVDREGRVVKAVRAVPPGRVVRCRGSCGVLERQSLPQEMWYRVGEELKICIRD